MRSLFAFAIFIVSFGFAANANETIILAQPDAPIVVKSYTARYLPNDRVGDGTIQHLLKLQSKDEQQVVVAYGVGIYVFDAFKRDLDRPFIGYSMDAMPKKSYASPIWEQRARSAYLFQNYGVGVAYIAIARMADGTIWRADESSITRQLRDYEFELTDQEN